MTDQWNAPEAAHMPHQEQPLEQQAHGGHACSSTPPAEGVQQWEAPEAPITATPGGAHASLGSPLQLPSSGPGGAASTSVPVHDLPRTAIAEDDDPLARGLSRNRSPQTEDAYLARVRQLQKWSLKKRSSPAGDEPLHITPLQVVEDFLESSSQRGKSAFNLYRSALLWYLAQRRNRSELHEQAYRTLAASKIPPTKVQRNAPKVISRKRTIPEADFNTLLNVLSANAKRTANRRGFNWAAATQWWMHAGMAAGLRPNEWEYAYWADDDMNTLMAPNSKQKVAPPALFRAGEGTVYDQEFPAQPRTPVEEAGGAHDQDLEEPDDTWDGLDEERGIKRPRPNSFRPIPIGQEARFWVDTHLVSIAEARDKRGIEFADYYEHCRQALWRACRTAFNGKKSYSLYSFRGQFTANKKNEAPLPEVGRLLGHTDPSFLATRRNYGRRAAGHGRAKGSAERMGEQLGLADAMEPPAEASFDPGEGGPSSGPAA